MGEQGIISYSDIKQYIEIKNQYHVFLINAIVFYDLYDITLPLKDKLKDSIDKAIK